MRELFNRIRFWLRPRNRKLPPPPQPLVLDAVDQAGKALASLANANFIASDYLESRKALTMTNPELITSLNRFYTAAEFNLTNVRSCLQQLHQVGEQ